MEAFRRYIINCFWTKRKAKRDSNPRRDLERKDRFAIFPGRVPMWDRFRFSLMANATGESEPFADEGSRTVLGIIRAGRSRRMVAHRPDHSRRDTSAFSPRSAMRFRGGAQSPTLGLVDQIGRETSINGSRIWFTTRGSSSGARGGRR